MYYNKLFGENNIDSRTIWKNINKLINIRPHKEKKITEIIQNDGTVKTDGEEISNSFNNSFIENGANLAKQKEEPNNTLKLQMRSLIRPLQNSIFISPITADELSRCLKVFSDKKSTPSVCGPMWIVRKSTPLILEAIATIFNKCVQEGVYPDIFKTAEVIPIFKAGSKTDVH